jgi:2'-5' RNA ligase
MKRTFIAFDIKPSETVIGFYDTLRSRLRDSRISWIDQDKLHITVKFLGDTEEVLIPQIISAVSVIIEKHEPFRLSLLGLGIFRNFHDPHVIWIGCRIEERLAGLKSELEVSLKAFGFMTETRKFAPHLTLGRIKLLRQTNQLKDLLYEFKGRFFQEVMINELIYYESRLTPSGSIYTPLHRFTIGPSLS